MFDLYLRRETERAARADVRWDVTLHRDQQIVCETRPRMVKRITTNTDYQHPENQSPVSKPPASDLDTILFQTS